MTVYIDKARIPYRGIKMCHMVADSTEELVAMAEAIGLKREWIQRPGTYREHFDVCVSKRGQALKLGAKHVTQKQLAQILRQRRASRP